MRRAAVQWSLALAIIVAAGSACGGDDEGSAASNVLVYRETYGATPRIFRIDADGRNRTLLYDGFSFEGLYPRPDGQRILLQDQQGWLTIPATGGNATRFTVPEMGELGPITPFWSPDGSAIAWLMWVPGSSNRVLVVGEAGSVVGELATPDSLDARWVAWSPGADKLVVCARNVDYDASLYTVNRDGSGFRLVRADSVNAQDCPVTWAPSSLIGFIYGYPWTMRADGSDAHVIDVHTEDPLVGIFRGPVYWAPNGTTLSLEDEYTTLWRVDARSGDSRRYSQSWRAPAANPWSPTGDQVLFLGDTLHDFGGGCCRQLAIGVMSAHGGDARFITPDSVNADSPAWLPE